MIEPRTALLILHAIGFALGLGVAIFLDVHMLRALKGQRRVDETDLALLRTGSMLVAAGLALLWLSGLGLTWLAWERNPAFLGNPKLHAKLAIVLALTLNGVVLHRVARPHVAAQLGRGLFEGHGPKRQALLLACGAVSIVSWGAAFLLGMVRELNFTTPAGTILGAYAMALLAALALALRVASLGGAPGRAEDGPEGMARAFGGAGRGRMALARAGGLPGATSRDR